MDTSDYCTYNSLGVSYCDGTFHDPLLCTQRMVIASLNPGNRGQEVCEAGVGRELLVRCAGVLKPRCLGFPRLSLCSVVFCLAGKIFWLRQTKDFSSFLGSERLQWGALECPEAN